MSAEKSVTQVKYLDRTANPSYFAQIASGITFVLISLSTLGVFSRGSIIAPIGLFTGILQIVAGIMEWSKGSTFATTIFLSLGFFWLTFASLLVFPKMGLADAPSTSLLTAFFGLWGFFALGMFIGALKAWRALQIIFISLAVLFFLLAIGTITGNSTVIIVSGYEGTLAGLFIMYAGIGGMLNTVYEKTIAPL